MDMTERVIELSPPVRIAAPGGQDLRLALDVSMFDEIDLELQVVGLEGSGADVTVDIQTGMQTHSGTGWSIVATFLRATSLSSEKKTLDGFLRYIRWRVSGLNGTAATFLITGIGRTWSRVLRPANGLIQRVGAPLLLPGHDHDGKPCCGDCGRTGRRCDEKRIPPFGDHETLEDILPPSDGGDPGRPPIGLQGVPCSSTNLAPDAYFKVPPDFYMQHQDTHPVVLSSGSAAYYYRCDNKSCRWFIADVLLDSKSNTGGFNPLFVFINAYAYDLPSSEGPDGIISILPYDCSQLVVEMKAYYRHSSLGPPSYTLQRHNKRFHNWALGACSHQDAGPQPFPLAVVAPTEGTAYYRIAVRVKLRSSGQEAAVFIWSEPPT